MFNNLVKCICTFFYVGYFPLAPGSLASLVGVGIYFLFSSYILYYIIVFGVITLAGFIFSGKMEILLGRKDPGCVVIDEVSGILVALFLLPPTPGVIITAFFLFRAFDMFKIYPVHKFERFGGSAGIMLDDIIAGIYTNLSMHLALFFSGIK